MSAQFRLLVIDDDDLIIQSIRLGLPSQWIMTGLKLLPQELDKKYDAAFVDLHLTGDIKKAEGLKVIKSLSERDPHLEIVAISGNLDRDLMESCLKMGASRFLAKPLSVDELALLLGKIEALLLMQRAALRNDDEQAWVGSSAASQRVLRSIAQMKGEPGPILIEGETGAGKEVVTRLIHHQENRGPFIQLNVAAVPDNLFESELFGHVRGAFTGADQPKMGMAEAAHGGDLFLDEIEALSVQGQAKLLRFLESGEIRRVGSKDTIRVQVRVIAATNQPLEELVKKEKFREDLLWRLNGKKITVPPLRERENDVVELANYFLERDRPRRNKSLTAEAIEVLKTYPWPGNVRELKRVLEQVGLVSPLPIIRDQDLLAIVRPATSTALQKSLDLSKGLSALIEDFERDVIVHALKAYKDVDECARVLQISRSSIYKKIKDYNIDIGADL